MDRATFRAVVQKQLAGRPFAGAHTAGRAAAELEAWLYADDGEPAVVELVYVGESTPEKKQRRDFLTAALIDRAVQQACGAACDAEFRGGVGGLSPALLARAIEDQVRTLADVLTPQNAARHLSLPDGTRVGTVHRLEAPALLPAELERER
jgi:hypothetical protein